jgi:hypothetical protein
MMAIPALVVAGLLVVLLIGKSKASRIQEDVELWRESKRALNDKSPRRADQHAVAEPSEPDWNSEAQADILAAALRSKEDSRPVSDTRRDDATHSQATESD